MTVRDRVAKLHLRRADGRTDRRGEADADFDEQVGNAAQSADRFVQQLFAELGY